MLRWLAIVLVVSTPLVMADQRVSVSRDIASLEHRLATHPQEVETMQQLAAALLAEVRIAPRAEMLARAEGLIARLLLVDAPRATALHAWHLLIAHRFDEALVAARHARHSGGDDLLALSSEADALTELGRYDEAEGVVQTLLDQHYGVAALARASHLRRLFGDLPGAIELAQRAVSLSTAGRDRAWLQLDLASLQLTAGAAATALALATDALSDLPAAALAVQARAQRALGNADAALALYRVATTRDLRAETLVETLSLALAGKDQALVLRTQALLAGMARLDAASGGSDRRSFVEFHLLTAELASAASLARAEWLQRPDVYSAAQLAWVLWREGKRDEAQRYATRAIAYHTAEPLLQWRCG
ncbi:unnamed protein product, partial [Phaeothamnion confervicola]